MAFPQEVRQVWDEGRTGDADECSRLDRRCESARIRIGERVAFECGETRQNSFGEGESIPGRWAIVADNRLKYGSWSSE